MAKSDQEQFHPTIQAIVDELRKRPAIEFKATANEVRVLPASDEGFAVSLRAWEDKDGPGYAVEYAQ